MSLAGKFFIKGAAPPPSRKFMTPAILLMLVDARPPLKYGTKLTATPLYMPLGFKIPGTLTPLLG